MKRIFNSYPFFWGMILFILLLTFSIFFANTIWSIPLDLLHIPKNNHSAEISSRSIVALLMLCVTALCYKLKGENFIRSLQLQIKKIPLIAAGFAIGLLVMFIIILLNCPLFELKLTFNPDVDYRLLLSGLLMILPGVVLEELLFRGYPFLQTSNKTNTTVAVIIFGLLFILFHCYQYIFAGNYAMIIPNIMTGIWHVLFVMGIIKTGSLYMSIGLHIGTNWASQCLVNGANMQLTLNEKNNKAIFYIVTETKSTTATQDVLAYAISCICILLAAWLLWKYFPVKYKSRY